MLSPYQENWQYHYSITDHLGNLRAEYADLNGDGHIAENEVLQLIDYHPYGMKRRNTLNHTLKNNYQYNGIDHVDDYGLSWNMATYRSLDGAIGIWNRVDPYAESFYGMSPYNSMANNPISNVDPEGDFVHILIGAGVGAVINIGVQAFQGNINSLGDLGMAALIGGGAGALGAATGGAAFAAAGSAGIISGTGGVLGGAIAGASGGAVGGFVQGTGNALYFGDKNIGEALGQGLKEGAIGLAVGGVTGGIAGGIRTGLHNAKPSNIPENIWKGETVAPGRNPWSLNNTPVQQAGTGAITDLRAPMSKLQHVYGRHSEDFGFGDVNWNKQTAKEFFDVLGNHVNDPNIWTYSGTYRGNIPAMHYYNPNTHQWVGTTLSGDLLSAWRLSPEQVRYMILLGNIQ